MPSPHQPKSLRNNAAKSMSKNTEHADLHGYDEKGEGPKLCLSLLPRSLSEVKEWLPQCEEADLVEIRLDHLPKLDFKKIRPLTGKPLIAALRSRREGGHWEGSPAEALAALRKAIKAGVEYVDVEFSSAEQILPKLKPEKSRILLSHHAETANLSRLKSLLQQMVQIPAEAYKLIYRARSLHDNLVALELMEMAKALQLNFIIHAQGEAGQLSRLLGALRGNRWTYVCAGFARETAPGQLSLYDARRHYALPAKSPGVKILGLVGSPLRQSSGWRLHNRLIAQKISRKQSSGELGNVSGAANDFLYLNFPTDHLDEFWLDWCEGAALGPEGLHGLSVTIPYKEKIVKHLNEASTEVKISGVCNTVVREGQKWKGYNTDLIALETLLRPYREELKNGGLVVGTGATARSAIVAMKRLEATPIYVIGRNVERGKLLAETFGIDFLEEGEVHYASAAVIVQTTPVGMAPHPEKYPVGTALFRKDRVVLDVIYKPEETRFLQIARERGCTTISGVEMFLLQAAKQFELFTGIPVTLEEVREAWKEAG